MIGYALCGSFCTHQKSLEALRQLVRDGMDVLPIVSETAAGTDTRFGRCEDLIDSLTAITGKNPVLSIKEAEPLGPHTPLDALIISPCTGNTLAKIAQGITDTTVCMAAKAHMRTSKPLLIALATNDGLSGNLTNLATLLGKKNVYFVPMRQDDPKNKPHSLVADFRLLAEAYDSMMEGRQLRPLFLPPESP